MSEFTGVNLKTYAITPLQKLQKHQQLYGLLHHHQVSATKTIEDLTVTGNSEFSLWQVGFLQPLSVSNEYKI